MFKRLFTAATLFGVASTAPPAMAQQVRCALRDSVTMGLSQKYNEQLVAGGLQDSQHLLEVWASSKTGTFTIILTLPNGKSCIVASGTDFQQKFEKVKQGTPS